MADTSLPAAIHSSVRKTGETRQRVKWQRHFLQKHGFVLLNVRTGMAIIMLSFPIEYSP